MDFGKPGAGRDCRDSRGSHRSDRHHVRDHDCDHLPDAALTVARRQNAGTSIVTITGSATAPPIPVSEFRSVVARIEDEVATVMVGQAEVVRDVLICLIAGGHALLEGVPGLGKTMLVRTLAEALDLDFSRIQFTPDLMPADILGTNMVMEDPDGKRSFEFQKGPIFSQICLADEINRATPKTQSAMLETMQEGSVTVAGQHYQLKKPF